MGARDEELKARLLATFRVEAEEHLASLTSQLLALGADLPSEPSRERVEATFRAMHTLKGAARSVGMIDVEALCQACELVLSGVVRGRLAIDGELVDLLQEAVDRIAGLVTSDGDLAAARALARRLADAAGQRAPRRAEPRAAAVDADAAPPPAGPATVPEAGRDTIRLDARKLDALLAQSEDLLAAKLAVAERAKEARDVVSGMAAARAVLRGRRAQVGGTVAAAGSALADLRAAEAGARQLLERLSRDEQLIGGAVDRLLEQVRRTRMTPASTILDVVPRMVRDLAREDGKDVECSIRGGAVELDRRVLEAVKDPLIHLVRNAVDHGIEPPEERAAAGKDRRGRLAITVASREDGRAEIVVEDDGRGIDPARVRDAAVRARATTADAARDLTDDEVLALVFRSGFSTSPVITDVSGHGLGLAIVREQVQRIDGDVWLESRRGDGTRACMVLPTSVATFRGLLVSAGGQRFLVPLEATRHVVAVRPDDVGSVEGREVIHSRGESVPIVPLDAALQIERADQHPGEAERACVVVAVGSERAGLIVDEVVGEEEVLVKDLAAPLVRVRCIAGVGLLGSGQLVLILRTADVIQAARRARRPLPAADARAEVEAPLVLVVDDAVTTRTMERNVLEAVGYRVRVAVDGAEAWGMLKREPFDLVVSDVDMPRMDGFELTARIRADARLAELPVVLVSALEAREDKERGVEVGANAYVVKSRFEQSNLLEVIRRLGVVVPGGAAH